MGMETSRRKFKTSYHKTLFALGILLSLVSCVEVGSGPTVLGEEAYPVDTVFISVVDTFWLEAPIPVNSSNPRQEAVDTLMKYIGRSEEGRTNAGPEINFLFEGCGFPPGVAWCGCTINYAVRAVGYEGPSAPAWTPSWFPKDRIVWDRDVNFDHDLTVGDVFGIYFTSKGRIAHIGIVAEVYPDEWILCIEGNGNESGSRDGGTIVLKLRRKYELKQAADWI